MIQDTHAGPAPAPPPPPAGRGGGGGGPPPESPASHKPRLARLTVRDTGTGMTPETIARIFEPYFTTKPRGQGTGLGLSIIHGIITEHAGTISVDSRPDAGSTFTVLLPAIAPPEDARDPARERRSTSREGATRTPATALLIDPNPFIREVVASMLTSMNFEVLQAADAAAATRLAKSANRRFDLLIAAAQLPDATGAQTISLLRDTTNSPATNAILISAAPTNGNTPANTTVLLHPFRRADLVKEIERLRA